MKNKRIYITTYDGFIVVCDDKSTAVYEGEALCPADIKRWLKTHDPIRLPYIWQDAVSYGIAR